MGDIPCFHCRFKYCQDSRTDLKVAVHVGRTRLTCLLKSLTGKRGRRTSHSFTPSEAPTEAVRKRLYASEDDNAEWREPCEQRPDFKISILETRAMK